MVKVRAAISKTRKPYFCFIASSTCELILLNLEYRRKRGERLTPDSPLIGAKFLRHEGHIHSLSVVRPLKNVMDKHGIQTPAYAWRSYFSHFWMRYAKHSDYGEFFMGHDCGIAGIYRLRKDLPPESVDEMRQEFDEVTSRLLGEAPSSMGPYADVAAAMLRIWGLSEADIDDLKLAGLSSEDLTALLQEHCPTPIAGDEGETQSADATQQGAAVQGKPLQRILQATELEKAVEEGWTFKAQLADGRVVLESV